MLRKLGMVVYAAIVALEMRLNLDHRFMGRGDDSVALALEWLQIRIAPDYDGETILQAFCA